jgi:hypothetical protein
VHSLPGRTWQQQQQAGFRQWLYYVGFQLEGDGMVMRFVMKIMKSDGSGAHSNWANGAIQKCLHYFKLNYFHYVSYLNNHHK